MVREGKRTSAPPRSHLGSWLSAGVLLAALACSTPEDGTFVLVHIERGDLSGAVHSLEVQLALAGHATPETRILAEGTGGEIALPTSVAFQFNSGAGLLTVTVTARGANGVPMATGSTQVVVERKQSRTVTVVLGMEVAGTDGGMVVPDGGGGNPDGGSAARLQVDRESIRFDPLLIGQVSVPVTVTVSNLGTAPTGPVSVGLTQGGTHFSLAANTCVGVLEPAALCTFQVMFSPAAPAGSKSDVLTINANPPGRALSVMLSGEALLPSSLTITPTMHAFAPIELGSMAPEQVFTVRNTGQAITNTIIPALTGAGFTLGRNTCGRGLSTGQTCEVGVFFAPRAVGSVTGSLTITAGTQVAVASLGGTGTARLSVFKTGLGTVTSIPTGIDCGRACSASFSGPVTLTAAADISSLFTGWSGGGCMGTGPCTVNLTGPTSVTATFTSRPINLTVAFAPGSTGSGAITSNPVGIDCGNACVATFPYGTLITLTATPDAGSTFTGWSGGGCSGTGPCTVDLTNATSVFANFERRRYTLTVQLAGNSQGSVSSTPMGIACPGTCSAMFDHGAPVILTASANMPANQFNCWSGGSCMGTGGCNLMLTANTTVTASFGAASYPLTVQKTGNGFGNVTASAGAINCGETCTGSYNYNQNVTLTATPLTAPESQRSTFVGWSLASCPGTGPCTVTITQATTVMPRFDLVPNFAFVTSSGHTGNLGGLAGADAICQQRAGAANRPGTYRAWLSTTATSASSRFVGAGGWVRVDGRPFANTLADLLDGKNYHPLRIDEHGSDVGDSMVFTATQANGALNPNGGTTCNTWTSTQGGTTGGTASGMGDMWTALWTGGCNLTIRFYCLGIDRNATVTLPAPSGMVRYAFTTGQAWLPGSGLASADALCQAEAQAAGLPGTYRALLATSSASAASRFDTAGPPWVRPDGVPITPTASTMFSSALWNSAPNTTADQTRHLGNPGLWTGATTFTTAGTVSSTCNDWTSMTSGPAYGSRAGLTHVGQAASYGGLLQCNTPGLLLRCLQR